MKKLLFFGCILTFGSITLQANENIYIKDKKKSLKESKSKIIEDIMQYYQDLLLSLRKLAHEVEACEDNIIETVIACVHKEDDFSTKSKDVLCDLRAQLKNQLETSLNMSEQIRENRTILENVKSKEV